MHNREVSFFTQVCFDTVFETAIVMSNMTPLHSLDLSPAVITKLDDVVVITVSLRVHHHIKQ